MAGMNFPSTANGSQIPQIPSNDRVAEIVSFQGIDKGHTWAKSNN
jgi:hypothetical protein